ncbi:MAG: hypothetical protein NTV21_19935 [Planctomycetota bacterium]|nr:hypothetical protein [Planctomycetota bacterium]
MVLGVVAILFATRFTQTEVPAAGLIERLCGVWSWHPSSGAIRDANGLVMLPPNTKSAEGIPLIREWRQIGFDPAGTGFESSNTVDEHYYRAFTWVPLDVRGNRVTVRMTGVDAKPEKRTFELGDDGTMQEIRWLSKNVRYRRPE